MNRRLPWGSIYEHVTPKGVTKYRARSGEKSRRGLGLYDTYDDALIALDEARRAADAVERASGPAATFAAYGRAWFDREEKARIRRALGKERSRFAAHLERAPFALFPVAAIEQRDVQQWLRALVSEAARGHGEERTISRETAKRALALFRSIMRSAVIDGITDVNPGVGVVVPRGRSTNEAWTYLTLDEIDRVMECEAIPLRAKSIFIIAIFTGMRAGELFGLRWPDVHLAGKHPEVVVRYSRDDATKSGTVRRINLLPPAVAWFKKWRAASSSPDLVWPSPSGGHHADGYDAQWTPTQGRRDRVTGKRKVWPGAREKAGIHRDVRFHDFRHTCGSHLVSGYAWMERGWLKRPLRLEEVQQWLGHESIETTKRYAHLAPEGVRSALPSGTQRGTQRAKKSGAKSRNHASK